MSTSVELLYDMEMDAVVSRSTVLEIGGKLFYLSAGTVAGQKQPDGPIKENEDIFGVLSESPEDDEPPEAGLTLAVLLADGASSQKPIPELGGTSGARFASHSLKEIFESHGHIGEAFTMLRGLNRTLGQRLQVFPSINYNDLNSLPTSTGTLNRFDIQQGWLDIAHVGDTFTLALYENNDTALLTNNLHKQYDERLLQLIQHIAIECGITPREARKDERVHEAIARMFQTTRNTPDGSGEGMINGDPNMDQYIDLSSISLKGVKAIMSGTDGLVAPGMDERLHADRKRMFDIALAGGIPALIDYARYIADNDPDRLLLRTSHMDDASGTLIQSPSWLAS